MTAIFSTELILINLAILVLVSISVFFIVRGGFAQRLKALNTTNRRLDEDLNEVRKYHEAELRRNQYILQNHEKKNVAQNSALSSTKEKGSDTEKVGELIQNKQDLEREMENFQKKNQKLWEQSLAIHKEKERIDGLKKEIESKHRELTDSIRYAQRIQRALVPDEEGVSHVLNNYFILWRPRDIVSGDFYWIKEIRDYSIIVAADCTGHGVPGAFMSMLGVAFLNEVVNKIKDIKANIILEELRELVKISLQQTLNSRGPSDGMDMAMCIIDHKNKELQYAGANNPLLMFRNKELTQIKATSNPIAIYRKEKPFALHTISLEKGDQFYVFSDGYIDQFGGIQKRRYSTRRFKESLGEIQDLPMAQQKEELEKRMDEWQRDEKQLDDILVVGFQF